MMENTRYRKPNMVIGFRKRLSTLGWKILVKRSAERRRMVRKVALRSGADRQAQKTAPCGAVLGVSLAVVYRGQYTLPAGNTTESAAYATRAIRHARLGAPIEGVSSSWPW